MINKAWSVALMLLLQAAVASADDVSPEWLQRLLEASHKSSYKGHSVLYKAGELTSFRVYHGVFDGEVWERVVHTSGSPIEVIRKGAEVTCLYPNQVTRLATRATLGHLNGFKKGVRSAANHYDFIDAGPDRVAGRSAIKINVSPQDAFRYGYSFWLDAQVGLLLKSQIYSDQTQPIEIFEFINIDTGAELDREDFEPALPQNQRVTSPPVQPESNQAAVVEVSDQWAPGWVPAGFHRARQMSSEDKPGLSSRVYTDGLAAFTIFYEFGDQLSGEQIQFSGATVALNRDINGAVVTVVGEIPLVTAQKIADSISP